MQINIDDLVASIDQALAADTHIAQRVEKSIRHSMVAMNDLPTDSPPVDTAAGTFYPKRKCPTLHVRDGHRLTVAFAVRHSG